MWSMVEQVEDKTDLEYQAGQEDSGTDAQERPQGKKEKPQQGKAAAEPEEGAEPEEADDQQGTEDGPVNEDAEDRYEDRQFAAPKVNLIACR